MRRVLLCAAAFLALATGARADMFGSTAPGASLSTANTWTLGQTMPGLTNTGNETIAGTLGVTGASTMAATLLLTQPASIQFNGSRVWSGSQSAIGTSQFQSYTNQSGSTNTGNPVAFHFFSVLSDTLQSTGSYVANGYFSDTTGAGILGGRNNLISVLTIGATPGDGSQYVAESGQFQASAPANAAGNIGYGSNPTCGINAAATGAWSCVGEEIDVRAVAGSAPQVLTGLSIVQVTGAAIAGSAGYDSAVAFGNQGTVSGWKFGLRFGGPANPFPFQSTATLIGLGPSVTGSPAASYGINFTGITFATASIAVPGFSVAGSGHIIGSGTAPTIMACGITPSIVGSDVAGTITGGTGLPTGCTITFATAYVGTPSCNVTSQTQLAAFAYTVSPSAIATTMTATSSGKINYTCVAPVGG